MTVLVGDCVSVMAGMDEGSVDAIVTDPPYGLGFMGKQWDDLPPGLEFAEQALRVLKPGGHILAFGGTRTYHRLTVAIEDAGFEVRDCLSWLYGSGFPKSHNLKDEWQGFGTALKPSWEPIVMARKPLAGTVAANVLEHGVGALNIDGCRIEGQPEPTRFDPAKHSHVGWRMDATGAEIAERAHPSGRWPANTVLDEQAAAILDEQVEDTSRFFYVAKASRKERNAGLEGFEERSAIKMDGGSFRSASTEATARVAANTHPTVKPINLMRWLVRMVTPPEGTVLDPFTGSGTTGCAAALEGFEFIGIEREAEYAAIAESRIEHWTPDQLELA